MSRRAAGRRAVHGRLPVPAAGRAAPARLRAHAGAVP
jgi:hypothetical protein